MSPAVIEMFKIERISRRSFLGLGSAGLATLATCFEAQSFGQKQGRRAGDAEPGTMWTSDEAPSYDALLRCDSSDVVIGVLC